MRQFLAVLLVAAIVITTPVLASAGKVEAMDFLGQLVAIPDQHMDSAAQNRLMQERSAAVMIQGYARCLADGFPKICQGPHPNYQEMVAALAELNAYLPAFAEQKLGGKDKLAALQRTNPGLRVLAKMSAMYK